MQQQLKDFLRSHTFREYTAADEDYHYLRQGQSVVRICNPHGGEDLFIKLDEQEHVVSFGAWNGYYEASEGGLQNLLHDVENIINDDSYVWCLEMPGRQMVGLVNDAMMIFPDLMASGKLVTEEGKTISFDPKQFRQDFIFWDPAMVNPDPSPFLS